MIVLVIVPLVWADPESRKVLVHDEGKPSERFAGEDGEGFYSVLQAFREINRCVDAWDVDYPRLVAPCNIPLCAVARIDQQLVGVYIEHFSAPADADDHFVEVPLLALLDVPEDTLDTQTGPVAASTVGAAPVPHKVPGGNTAMSTLSGEQPFPELFGGME